MKRKYSYEDISNTQIECAITDWIHNEVDRRILRKKLIDGKSYSQICDELYKEDKTVLTERQIQNRMYKSEDILFKHL